MNHGCGRFESLTFPVSCFKHGHRHKQPATLAETASSNVTDWDVAFLNPSTVGVPDTKRGLIILNQSFSRNLPEMLWTTCSWHADGGANRLFDVLKEDKQGDLRSQWV